MVFLQYRIIILSCYRINVLSHHLVLLSYYRIIILSCYRSIISSYHLIAVSSYRATTCSSCLIILSYYRIIIVSYYHLINLRVEDLTNDALTRSSHVREQRKKEQESQSTRKFFRPKKRKNGKHTKTLYKSQTTYCVSTKRGHNL